MQRKIQEMEAERQRTEEFRNRSAEENLRNFINVNTYMTGCMTRNMKN
mgnify:CR=1 FL=1